MDAWIGGIRGWMGGNAWVDGWMDAWNRSVDACNRCVDAWIAGWVDG